MFSLLVVLAASEDVWAQLCVRSFCFRFLLSLCLQTCLSALPKAGKWE